MTHTLRDALAACRATEREIDDLRDRLADERKSFAREVRRARAQTGLTAADVAKHCGVSKGFYSDFELGRRWSDNVVAKLITLFAPTGGTDHETERG